ncbi:hypothetical protein BDV23DRAFT_149545, partial [Aspergillus alliaceus]
MNERLYFGGFFLTVSLVIVTFLMLLDVSIPSIIWESSHSHPATYEDTPCQFIPL